MVVVAGVALMMGQAQESKIPDVIIARAFVVVNEDGKKCVNIGGLNDGGFVGIYNGEEKMNVFPHGGGSSITTRNGKGQNLVSITATVGGEGMVVTRNGKGQDLVAITTNDGGDGVVVTYNNRGKKLVEITSAKDDTGTVAVFDPTGRERPGILTTRP